VRGAGLGPGRARGARATTAAAPAGHAAAAARSAATPSTPVGCGKRPICFVGALGRTLNVQEVRLACGSRAPPRIWTFAQPAALSRRPSDYRTVTEAAAAWQLLVSLASVTTPA
jgi:hypothetical protein